MKAVPVDRVAATTRTFWRHYTVHEFGNRLAPPPAFLKGAGGLVPEVIKI